MLPLTTFVKSNFSLIKYIPLSLTVYFRCRKKIMSSIGGLGGGAIYTIYTKYFSGRFWGK